MQHTCASRFQCWRRDPNYPGSAAPNMTNTLVPAVLSPGEGCTIQNVVSWSAVLTNHTRGGAVWDSCLATPSSFFSLLRHPPLTKRTKREVLSCEFSSWGQPTPLPFCPDSGSAMYMWGVCCVVATAGVCSEPVCVLVESKETQQAAASGGGSLLNAFRHLLGPEATVCIKTKPNRLI